MWALCITALEIIFFFPSEMLKSQTQAPPEKAVGFIDWEPMSLGVGKAERGAFHFSIR